VRNHKKIVQKWANLTGFLSTERQRKIANGENCSFLRLSFHRRDGIGENRSGQAVNITEDEILARFQAFNTSSLDVQIL
jgi:hypothetical protein